MIEYYAETIAKLVFVRARSAVKGRHYLAAMRPEQARELARQLYAEADKLDPRPAGTPHERAMQAAFARE